MIEIVFITTLKFSIFLIFTNLVLSLFNYKQKQSNLFCGIIGYSGNNHFDKEKIRILGIINDLERGGDSVGIYTPELGIHKKPEAAYKFFLNDKNDFNTDKVLIGHLRRKSVGVNSEKNAHPYEENGLVLCHNGTLHSYYDLSREYNIKYTDWDTDSHLLTHILGKTFNPEKFPEILLDYSGSAALLFTKKDSSDIIYAYRDYQRPLFYGFDENKGMYISSIEWALNFIKCDNIRQFSEDTIFAIKNGEIIDKKEAPKYINYSKQNNNNKSNNSSNLKPVNLAERADILEYILDDKQVFKFLNDRKFSGIIRDSVKAKYLIGFNMRYSGPTVKSKIIGNNQTFASVTREKNYKVVGKSETTTEYVVIIDDRGLLAPVSINYLNFYDFIPREGNYIKLVTDIFYSTQEEAIAFKGDYLLVTRYSFGDERVSIFNPRDGKNYTIPIDSFITILQKEVGIAVSTTGKLIKKREELDKINTEEKIEDMKDTKKELTEDDLEIIDDDEEEVFFDSQLTSETIYNIANELIDIVRDIEFAFDKKEDIKPYTFKLKKYIEDCLNNNLLI